jgi:predicted amidohydrolase YtcJ
MMACFFLLDVVSYRAHDDRSFVDIDSRRYPAEALTRTQALRGMTCDAAYAAFAEDTRGRLAPGFAADFVVLDRDIMQVPLKEILGTKVLATVVDGQVAYGSL